MNTTRDVDGPNHPEDLRHGPAWAQLGGRARGRALARRASVTVSITGAILGVLVSTLALCPPALAGPGSAGGLAAPSGSLATSLASGSTASGSVKYYIVGPPINGQPEYLFAIATRTLGNGKRADEVFELNKGRRQPDGSALVDPAVPAVPARANAYG